MVALGAIEVDTGRREVRLAGEVVPLATREFDLLAYLVDNLGLALSRRQLLDGVWGDDWYGDERTVDVHVRQLRKKLGDRPTPGHRVGRRLPTRMRRRLTIAILVLVAATVVVTTVGSYYLHPARRHLHRPAGARRPGPGHLGHLLRAPPTAPRPPSTGSRR